MALEGISQQIQRFTETYGTEAAEKAKTEGLFNKLETGAISYNALEEWADKSKYPKLPPPSGDMDIKGASEALAKFQDLAVLFHTVLKNIRGAQREESFLQQEKIVNLSLQAADKKTEAAATLLGCAIGALVMSFVTGALNIFVAFVGAVVGGIADIAGAGAKAACEGVKEAAKAMLTTALAVAAKIVAAVIDGVCKALAKAMEQLGSAVQTSGQAGSQFLQADGDRITAVAEGVKGSKQKTDDFIQGLRDTMKSIQSALQAIHDAEAKARSAASHI